MTKIGPKGLFTNPSITHTCKENILFSNLEVIKKPNQVSDHPRYFKGGASLKSKSILSENSLNRILQRVIYTCKRNLSTIDYRKYIFFNQIVNYRFWIYLGSWPEGEGCEARLNGRERTFPEPIHLDSAAGGAEEERPGP
jgi:hypothetical protein